MKSTSITFFAMILLIIISCNQKQDKASENSLVKFEEFKSKEKFNEDKKMFYPGISNPHFKKILTDKINLAADDFEKLSEDGNTTDKEYQDAIKVGLNRFSDIYLELDTEDRERICNYFEELMDLVALESSGGHLNMFMYGFDPTRK